MMAAYCHFYSHDPGFGWGWDYFWKMVEKYERKDDLQIKMRIMQRLLYVTCGVQGQVVTEHIKRGIPVIKLINEILDTQERLDKRGEYYMFGAAHFYTRVALIYYYFKLFDKAVPLFRKAARMPSNFYFDRSVMNALDYLGDYYWLHGNDYDRADSLYLSILNSPDRVIMRPVDDLVAFGRIAGKAFRSGHMEEALRMYLVALPMAHKLKNTWLCVVYAVYLGRTYMELGEMDKAKEMIDLADAYICNGTPRTDKWEKYYMLCRDYYLRMGNEAAVSHYIDSIDQMMARKEEVHHTPVLFYAHQQTYEAGLALKEEQLRRQRTRVVFMLIILAMSLLISGILLYFYRRLQAKNRYLFSQIKEQDLLAAQYQELLLGYHSLAKLRDVYGDKNSAPKADELAGMRQRELFVRLREYLLEDRNFAKPTLDSNMLIAELSTNRNYLFEAIKTSTGKTLQEYINDIRLEEAKQMLETSDEIIESIGMKCGYSSVRTFYRLFRAKYNISPALYRKLAREQRREK